MEFIACFKRSMGIKKKERKNLSDLCESGDGVADVIVDVQPGQGCSRIPRGIW